MLTGIFFASIICCLIFLSWSLSVLGRYLLERIKQKRMLNPPLQMSSFISAYLHLTEQCCCHILLKKKRGCEYLVGDECIYYALAWERAERETALLGAVTNHLLSNTQDWLRSTRLEMSLQIYL